MGIIQNYIEGNHTSLNKLTHQETSRDGSEPLVLKKIPTLVSEQGHSGNQLTHRADDLKRLAKLFTKPAGLKFLRNQVALSATDLSDVKDLDSLKKRAGQGLLVTAKTIASTLAQVPVNGTGTHFVYQFKTDTYLQSSEDPRSTIAQLLGAGGVEGAPLALRGEKITTNIKSSNFTETATTSNTAPDGTIESYSELSVKKGIGATEPTFSRKLADALDQRKETRITTGQPGKHSTNIITPRDEYYQDSVDKINAMSPYQGGLKSKEGTDMAKFRFKIITPETQTYVHFRAYLDALGDSYAGNWNTFQYVGRGEDFHTYNGFSRTTNVGFKIAAHSRAEMRPLYQKIVALASSTAPTYSDKGFMRGTIVQMTIGGYVYEQPGIIESVNYTWNSDYQWEIALDSDQQDHGDSYQQELPMLLDCSLNFKPIHNFVPQTGLYPYITNPNPNRSGTQNPIFMKQPRDASSFGTPMKDESISNSFQNNTIPGRQTAATNQESNRQEILRDL